MAEEHPVDAGDEPEAAPSEERAARLDADHETVRRLAYHRSLEHPDATAEENWLAAEAAIRAAQLDHDRREAEVEADESTAALMAKIEMSVYGHS